MFIPLIFRTRGTSAHRVTWSTGMIYYRRSDWRTPHDHARKTEHLGKIFLAGAHRSGASRNVELFGEMEWYASFSVAAQRGKGNGRVAPAPRVVGRYSRLTAPRRFRVRDRGAAGNSVWPRAG